MEPHLVRTDDRGIDTSSRKDRMISLRLTDKEFRTLRKVCKRRGIRTLSALARIALAEMAQDGSSMGAALSPRVTAMEKRVSKLELAVRQLRRSGRAN